MNKEKSNIGPALARAVGDEMSVSTEVSDEGTADKQILIRIPEKDRERWKQASEVKGITLSQLIRDSVNREVEGVLDCQHPVNRRRFYPWAEFCLECKTRLRG